MPPVRLPRYPACNFLLPLQHTHLYICLCEDSSLHRLNLSSKHTQSKFQDLQHHFPCTECGSGPGSPCWMILGPPQGDCAASFHTFLTL